MCCSYEKQPKLNWSDMQTDRQTSLYISWKDPLSKSWVEWKLEFFPWIFILLRMRVQYQSVLNVLFLLSQHYNQAFRQYKFSDMFNLLVTHLFTFNIFSTTYQNIHCSKNGNHCVYVHHHIFTDSGRLAFPQKARLSPVVDRAVGRLTF